jgi:hypothetical protein
MAADVAAGRWYLRDGGFCGSLIVGLRTTVPTRTTKSRGQTAFLNVNCTSWRQVRSAADIGLEDVGTTEALQ